MVRVDSQLGHLIPAVQRHVSLRVSQFGLLSSKYEYSNISTMNSLQHFNGTRLKQGYENFKFSIC